MEQVGPGMWYVLHLHPVFLKIEYGQLGSKEKTRKSMSDVFDLIYSVIPCLTCKQHMRLYSMQNSIHVCDDFSMWASDLHSDVNRRIGKNILTFAQQYTWCQKCIVGGFGEQENLDVGRKLWKGLLFIFATTLGGRLKLSYRCRLQLLSRIARQCHCTFPHLQSRNAFLKTSQDLQVLSAEKGVCNRKLREASQAAVADMNKALSVTLDLPVPNQGLSFAAMMSCSAIDDKSSSASASRQLLRYRETTVDRGLESRPMFAGHLQN